MIAELPPPTNVTEVRAASDREQRKWSNLDVEKVAETGIGFGEPGQIKQARTEAEVWKENTDSLRTLTRSRPESARDNLTVGITPSIAALDETAVRILRTHYVRSIIDALGKIQPHAQSIHVARYASDLLASLNAYINGVPSDPLVELALVVYPALADENKWVDWTADQYAGLRDVLLELGNRVNVNHHAVEKAILKIEDLANIDPLPFEVDPSLIS